MTLVHHARRSEFYKHRLDGVEVRTVDKPCKDPDSHESGNGVNMPPKGIRAVRGAVSGRICVQKRRFDRGAEVLDIRWS